MRVSRRAVLASPLLLAVPSPAVAQPSADYATLLAEEHAAIHLYGVLAPRLPTSLRDAARAVYDDHRRHRDELLEAIRAAGQVPEAPKLTYEVPLALTGPAAARELAIRIEDSLGLRWHAALRTVPAADRSRVAAALADEAEHLATYRWSATRRVRDAAPPFPGR